MWCDEKSMVTGSLHTLVDVLRHQARAHPNRTAYIYLEDGEQKEQRITYAELDRRARSIAALLQSRNMAHEPVLLMYPAGLEFLAAFFGCLYARNIAVPTAAPRLNRPVLSLQRIIKDSGVALALTDTDTFDGVRDALQGKSQVPELQSLEWIATDQVPATLAEDWKEPEIADEMLVLLQYTSGTTATPKGVMVTHRNILSNSAAISCGFQHIEDEIGVFWLPFYHDMGLVGGMLQPLCIGRPSILLSPQAFSQSPVRWLRAISRYGGTITGAPNFAYEICVTNIKPEQRASLDLSSLRLAFCGAERVKLSTLQRFLEAFAPQGLRPGVLYPCYGLAEATLFVSGGAGPGQPKTCTLSKTGLEQNRVELSVPGSAEGQTFVSCGQSWLTHRVVIAHPETQTRCASGEIGEIWFSGPSVTAGYWRKPDATAETFAAYLRDSGEGPFLRTGDLGFLYEEELFCNGRLKDLIILQGVNHYPQDLEATAQQSHPALEAGSGAAFSVEVDDEERIVIVYEVGRHHLKADFQEVADAVRRNVAQQHNVPIHALVFVKSYSLPRTSSGKIMRHACKRAFLEGTFTAIGEWRAMRPLPDETAREAAATSTSQPVMLLPTPQISARLQADIESWLTDKVATLACIERGDVDIRQTFMYYGLNSVQAVSLAAELEAWLGHSLSPVAVYDFPTIESLTGYLVQEVLGLGKAPTILQTPYSSQNNPLLSHMLTEVEALSDEAATREFLKNMPGKD